MSVTRRTALLSALGIGVASRLPVAPTIAPTPLAQAAVRSSGVSVSAGWCAPSELMYNLVDMETIDGLVTLPEVKVHRGGIRYGSSK